MKKLKQAAQGDEAATAKTELLAELKNMSQQELLQQFRLLQAEIEVPIDVDRDERLAHELQVYQIELEMQNRELQEAQQELELTRDRYADLYDFAPVSYVTFDAKGIIKNINLTGAAMLNQPRANIIDHPFLKWVSTADVNVFFQHLQKTLQTDSKTADEIQIKNQQGELFNVRLESIRSRSAAANVFLCQSVMLNVTEQKQAQNEISLQARQLKLITDALPVMIAYLDADEQHLFANKTYIDWFALSPAKIIGKRAREVWEEKIYSKVKTYLNIALLGRSVTFDMDLPVDEAEKKYIGATIIPDYDVNQQVHGVILLIGDITERLALEVVDRKRLLDAAHVSRLNTMGEMASEIAHDLNQPLAAISIYSDACRRMIELKKAKPEAILQILTDISAQAERASDVMRRIRAFVSKKELLLVKTSINEVIEEAMYLLNVELRSHDVKLILSLADNLPLVLVDRILIEQVVLNLARNAIEAMETIDIAQRLLKIYSMAEGLNEIEVSIEDAGPGMSSDEMSHIFEPFHTSKKNGMGMGLAICHSIIDTHHGRLWATSNDHGGTIFSFTLPLIVEEPDHEA